MIYRVVWVDITVRIDWIVISIKFRFEIILFRLKLISVVWVNRHESTILVNRQAPGLQSLVFYPSCELGSSGPDSFRIGWIRTDSFRIDSINLVSVVIGTNWVWFVSIRFTSIRFVRFVSHWFARFASVAFESHNQ